MHRQTWKCHSKGGISSGTDRVGEARGSYCIVHDAMPGEQFFPAHQSQWIREWNPLELWPTVESMQDRKWFCYCMAGYGAE